MKKAILSLSMMILGFAIVSAQTETPVDNPNAPEISFEKLVHDYGDVNKGDDGTCEFKFTNTGKEPLILSNVRSSCGCTVPSWPREPILPGKSSSIKVKYNTTRIGIINKNVTVNSNGKNSTVVLTIKGNVLNTPDTNVPVQDENKEGTPKVQ
ncbi:MAG: DUF1573 domain-containing protein [Bacteroidetes bacterium]|nr:DUF1573 domain-containing protein [Bacteroidota bacterium]MBU1718510.1 DUF1573 domain-containing protein [Bacteroidota bacterium]